MKLFDWIHHGYVYGRRVENICRHFAELIPRNAAVLDVGCGDGLVAKTILGQRSDISITGIDVLARPETFIPVTEFDGSIIPYSDSSIDVVMFVDVLHHTDSPEILLREAHRVARACIIIKDHLLEGFAANATLRFMDIVGNERYGVRLPHNYWARQRWTETFAKVGLDSAAYINDLNLYPWWANWVFGRRLHFITKLVKTELAPISMCA